MGEPGSRHKPGLCQPETCFAPNRFSVFADCNWASEIACVAARSDMDESDFSPKTPPAAKLAAIPQATSPLCLLLELCQQRLRHGASVTNEEGDQIAIQPDSSPGALHSPASPPALQSPRRVTETSRRLAITSESTEQLASARWHSAFDALRSSESNTALLATSLHLTLRKNHVFGELDDVLLAKIASALRSTPAVAGDVVIRQGDAGDAFFLVASGELAAYKEDDNGGGATGSNSPVETYHAGDSFGELALMYDCPRQATIKCISQSALLFRLGRMAFRNLVMQAMLSSKAMLETQLRQIEALRSLEAPQIRQLAEAMETVTFAGGEYIAELGAPADALFIILSGEVTCHRGAGDELETRLKDGAVFGESCLSPSSRREANVVAVSSAVTCARLGAAECMEILGPLHRAIDRGFCSKVVGAMSLFASLTLEERSTVLHEMSVRHVAAGQTIIAQGTVGEAFYILKRGTVNVIAQAGTSGEVAKLSSLSVGDYFGERSLLKDEVTVASVVAVDAVELMCLPKAAFEALLGPMQAIIDREVSRRDTERRLSIGEEDKQVRWSDLELGRLLGEGSFGSVRLVLHRPTQTAYALKMLHKGHLIATNQIQNTFGEKRLLAECDHPFILACHGAFNAPARHVSLLLGLAQGVALLEHATPHYNLAHAPHLPPTMTIPSPPSFAPHHHPSLLQAASSSRGCALSGPSASGPSRSTWRWLLPHSASSRLGTSRTGTSSSKTFSLTTRDGSRWST